MKKNSSILAGCLLLITVFTGCIKNEDIIFNDASIIEWDLATYQARSGGFPFPLVTAVPQDFGRSILVANNAFGAPADPALNRSYPSVIRMRVNFVGVKPTENQTFPVRANTTYTTAIEGVHYTLLDKSVTIPKDSSFGYVRWQVLNPGTPPAGTVAVRVVFELQPNNVIKPSENYRFLGWQITQ
ncbi:MAG: DUF4843 domain-containing protein [Chitinophagaceae bacterium]|nr:DUF4843 domain-containing protein [Chitinophagaceae bacterium]